MPAIDPFPITNKELSEDEIEVYVSLLESREEWIIIHGVQDGALVNALQRRAAVVLQKLLREGFGLTAAEAMWKGTHSFETFVSPTQLRNTDKNCQ